MLVFNMFFCFKFLRNRFLFFYSINIDLLKIIQNEFDFFSFYMLSFYFFEKMNYIRIT